MLNRMKMSSNGLTSNLVMFAGVVYIGFGLLELVNYFFQKPIDIFKTFFYISIGVGVFEKHAWSRILCLIASGATIILGLYFYIMGGEVFWNGEMVAWGDRFVFLMISIHSFLLYILLRSDAKNLFSKGN